MLHKTALASLSLVSLSTENKTMSDFKLISEYSPTGDQPEAIRQLTDGVLAGDEAQVLLGVTGSGKTFTIANVIANVNKPRSY